MEHHGHRLHARLDDYVVLDAEHAAAYERQIARRGVLFTLAQARRFVAGTGENRMHRYYWEPAALIPSRVIAGIKALGVDVSNWERSARQAEDALRDHVALDLRRAAHDGLVPLRRNWRTARLSASGPSRRAP